jgi:hypothetical protein
LKKNIFKLAVVVVGLFLNGCGSRYQPYGYFNGGYSEVLTAKDSFIVHFRGNCFTNQETVMKYALKRASELAIQNGYPYFVIQSLKDLTITTQYENTNKKYSNLFESSIRTKTIGETSVPGVSLGIKCFHKRPKEGQVIDALYFLQQNKQ